MEHFGQDGTSVTSENAISVTEVFRMKESMIIKPKYQPSGEGGARSPPAKSKMAARGAQNGRQGVEHFFNI